MLKLAKTKSRITPPLIFHSVLCWGAIHDSLGASALTVVGIVCCHFRGNPIGWSALLTDWRVTEAEIESESESEREAPFHSESPR